MSWIRPASVPRPPRHAVIDRVLLDELGRVLGQPSSKPVTVVLHGADVEKASATALCWARAHRRRFSGGAFYVDITRFSQRSVADLRAVLGLLLRAVGARRRRIPADLGDRCRMFRARTAQRPVLVLADRVTEPSQVTVVVPTAPASVALVTSRSALQELALDGARFVRVEGPARTSS